jgi:hypothetical protein
VDWSYSKIRTKISEKHSLNYDKNVVILEWNTRILNMLLKELNEAWLCKIWLENFWFLHLIKFGHPPIKRQECCSYPKEEEYFNNIY